jgi:hypothetical protein
METADIAQQLRQQLILAQVRIMELEDARDELASKLEQADRTLTELQSMVQDRIAERDRQAGKSSEFETQLNGERQLLGEIRLSLIQLQARESELQKTLARRENTATERQARIDELEARLRAVKSSRSWRWTALLRSLERLFRRTPRE